MIRGATLLLLAGIAWGTAAAGGPAEAIAQASARIARASGALAEARGAPDPVAAISVAVSDYETALAALRAGVMGTAARERELALELADRREEIGALLAALQAASRNAPPARGLHPQGPLGAARAAAMLRSLAPDLEARADALAGDLAALAEARAQRAAGGAALSVALATLNDARAELRLAIAAAPAAPPEVDPALATLARRSDSLSALAEALEGDGHGAASEPQALAWPVAGAVLRGYRAPDAAGVRRPGIVLSAPPLSLVSAPADAQVRYAGPFLDYGYVVVLQTGRAALVVLAGLAELRVATGDAVKRGELLGLLGGRPLDVEEYVMLPVAGAGAGAGETLYIEIRHGRAPVDPEPWFSGRNG